MATLTRATAFVGLALAVFGTPTFAAAQTQADFDVCNQQAQARAGAGVSGSLATPDLNAGGSAMTSPGSATEANRRPNSAGRLSSSAGSPGTNIGTSSGLPSTPPEPSASPSSGVDPQLRGMGAAGAGNDIYRQAYRDCMKSRGF